MFLNERITPVISFLDFNFIRNNNDEKDEDAVSTCKMPSEKISKCKERQDNTESETFDTWKSYAFSWLSPGMRDGTQCNLHTNT